MARPTTYYINQSAKRYGIDPRAAIAVARGEGGLVNRSGDVGDLSGGGSYGPFQLYTKGALPSQYRGKPGQADQWAWSPQGIDYAIRKMKESGAGGLTGAQAVNAIVRRFERPADPGTSVKNALARYGAGGTGGPASAAPAGGAAGTDASGGGVDPRAARMQFAMSLINQIGKPVNANALLGPMMAMRNARQEPDSEREAATTGFEFGSGDSMAALKRLGVADAITSSVRTPAENRATGGSPTSYHLPGGPEAYDLNPRDPQFKNVIAAAKSNPGRFREFFYDPLGWYIKNGKVIKGQIGGHGDHGHVVFH